MILHKEFWTFRDQLGAILAEEAGVEKGSRVYANYLERASRMLSDHNHRPPADNSTEIGVLLAKHHAAMQKTLAERQQRANEGAQRVREAVTRRDALTGPPEGFAHVNVRDETTGLLMRLTLPKESVQQIAR